MSQSFQAVKHTVKYPTENQLEDYNALYAQERNARERAEAEAAVLRRGLENVCRIATRAISPYLTARERQDATRQLAKWCENAEPKS
jgi:hypothetical protein